MIGEAEWLSSHYGLLLAVAVGCSFIVIGLYLLFEEIRFRVERRRHNKQHR